MPLTDYTFKFSDTGVVLNDDSALFPFVDIEGVEGLDSAPFRETVRDHEGADGGFLDAEFEKGRDIVLEGVAYCNVGSEEVYLDSLKANFAPGIVLKPFYFKAPGVDERLLFCKSRGVRYSWEHLRRTGCTPIQFLLYAEDPRIYTSFLNSLVINFGGIATTGFGFDFGFDLTFGATIPVSAGVVTVGGNRPTPPVFTIAGPVVDPRIINETDSKSLNFSITLGGGDTLVVDTLNRTVILNGTTNRRNTLTTMDWFDLQKGDTTIRFGGASGSGTLTVAWRDAWR